MRFFSEAENWAEVRPRSLRVQIIQQTALAEALEGERQARELAEAERQEKERALDAALAERQEKERALTELERIRAQLRALGIEPKA